MLAVRGRHGGLEGGLVVGFRLHAVSRWFVSGRDWADSRLVHLVPGGYSERLLGCVEPVNVRRVSWGLFFVRQWLCTMHAVQRRIVRRGIKSPNCGGPDILRRCTARFVCQRQGSFSIYTVPARHGNVCGVDQGVRAMPDGVIRFNGRSTDVHAGGARVFQSARRPVCKGRLVGADAVSGGHGNRPRGELCVRSVRSWLLHERPCCAHMPAVAAWYLC